MADLDYTDEIWKPIPFAPDYAASTHGRIKRIHPSKSPKARFPVGHILALRPCGPRRNYLSVNMTVAGKAKNYNVHRVIAVTFLEPPPSPRHQSAHRDGNGHNNRLANLRWATQSENEQDKLLHGTYQRGETGGGCKLTEQQVLEIRASALSQSRLGAKYGVAQTTISKIKRRVRWAHI